MSGARLAGTPARKARAVGAARGYLGGLWRSPDFLKLWTGETISQFGAQVTTLALPLAAAVTLQATPAQVGLLGAARTVPFMLVTLFAGVWVDRAHRRRIMVATGIGRALLLAVLPLVAWRGLLRMEYLYVVGFLAGVLQVFTELAYQSYLPSLLHREQLVEANGKLQAGTSAAQIAGPGIAGWLVERAGAPAAILANVFSLLAYAGGVALIKRPEPAPNPAERRPGMWREIGQGLRTVLVNPYLRAMAGAALTYNVFSGAVDCLFILFATREVGIGPGLLGIIFGAGSIGALLGSLVAAWPIARLGWGRSMVAGYAFSVLPAVLLPLAGGARLPAVALLTFTFFLLGFGLAVGQVYVSTMRQAIIPGHLLGRVNAGYRFIISGFVPLGALLAGALGGPLGLRPALALFAVGMTLSLPWALFSPLRTLRQLPSPPGPGGS